jgi:hypothetical protein
MVIVFTAISASLSARGTNHALECTQAGWFSRGGRFDQGAALSALNKRSIGMLIALVLGTWVAINLVAIWCYARVRGVRMPSATATMKSTATSPGR